MAAAIFEEYEDRRALEGGSGPTLLRRTHTLSPSLTRPLSITADRGEEGEMTREAGDRRVGALVGCRVNFI